MRRTISAVILLALILVPAQITAAAPDQKPLRSGTIEGGVGLQTTSEDPALERSGCQYALDCLAWLQSGCDPALAGQDPVLTASIVDVGDLADGRTRRSFHMVAPLGEPAHPPWGLYPGTVVQLWRQNCTEIHHAKRHTIGSTARCEWQEKVGALEQPPYGVGVARCKAFRIPTAARWMTVSGYATTVHLSWTLT